MNVTTNAKQQLKTQTTPEEILICSTYFQEHHIIPKSMWKTEIGKQLQELKFHKDDNINTVLLPTTRNIPDIIKHITTPSKPNMTFEECARTSSIHLGRHVNDYIEHIRTNINGILDLQIYNIIKIIMLVDFLSRTKEQLLNGELKLQNEQQQEITHYKHNEKFKFIPAEFQVHHIIPQKIFNDEAHQFESEKFKSLKDGLKFIGADKHDIKNLIALPKANTLSEKSSNRLTPMKKRRSINRTVHNGKHQKYTEYVTSMVIPIFKDLEQKLASDPEDIKSYKEAAHKKLIDLTQKLEQRLIDGEPFDKWGEQPSNSTIRSSTTNSPTLLKENSKILTFDDSTLEIA